MRRSQVAHVFGGAELAHPLPVQATVFTLRLSWSQVYKSHFFYDFPQALCRASRAAPQDPTPPPGFAFRSSLGPTGRRFSGPQAVTFHLSLFFNSGLIMRTAIVERRGRCSLTKKAEREFDAVATMREIRDRLSRQIEGMTFEEEKRFIRERVPQKTVRHPGKLPNKALLPTARKTRRG